MSKTTLQLRVDPETAGTRLRLLADVSTRMGVDVNRIKELRIVKRSIDARQRRVMVNLTVDVFLDSEPRPDDSILSPVEYRELPADAPSAIVVGPAGRTVRLLAPDRGGDKADFARKRQIGGGQKQGHGAPVARECG